MLRQAQVVALDTDGGEALAVTAASEPKATVGQQVTVPNLAATPWAQERRSGTAFLVDAVTNAHSKTAYVANSGSPRPQ